MRKPQIAHWANQIVERVSRGQPCEDSFEELKAEWPDDVSLSKTARQLAGHANAARGEPILWLIGVDEERGVVGASHAELANWYPSLARHFNGGAPTFTDVNVVLDNEQTIVALQFETDQPPYVYRVPGPDARLEVPWREGRRTRSATRADLLSLLIPLQLLPDVEVTAAHFELRIVEASENRQVGDDEFVWTLDAWLYVSSRANDRIIIPRHRCSGSFTIDSCGAVVQFSDVSFATPPQLLIRQPVTPMISIGEDQLVVSGAGTAILTAQTKMPPDLSSLCGTRTLEEIAQSTIRFEIYLRPLDAGLPVVLQDELKGQETWQANSDRPSWNLAPKRS